MKKKYKKKKKTTRTVLPGIENWKTGISFCRHTILRI